MCTHYEKNVDTLGMALKLIEKRHWVLNATGDVVFPDDLHSLPSHTWPKAKAPVIIRTEAGCSLQTFRWGIPVDVKGATKRLTKYVTNAREDKLGSYTWRYAVAERRCLIPALAYYEYDGPEKAKWEVRYTVRDRRSFFVAGLWDTDPDRVTRSFSMVTTRPNALAAKIHDRMPLILTDDGARAWLGHEPLPPDRLAHLCAPFAAEAMESVALPPPNRKVSRADLVGQDELML